MINWLFLCNCFLYVTVHVMMAEEMVSATKYILYIMTCKILLIIILLFSLSF